MFMKEKLYFLVSGTPRRIQSKFTVFFLSENLLHSFITAIYKLNTKNTNLSNSVEYKYIESLLIYWRA